MGHRIQVDVSCAICGKIWTVKPSRAAQNKAITCSAKCVAALRSKNRIAYFGSAGKRSAKCCNCGKIFERKPSQIEKYPRSYCSRECHSVDQHRPNLARRNGEHIPCEVCETPVYRTTATKEAHTFCSRKCSRKGLPEPKKGKPVPSMRGPKHHNWKGGISFEPYTPGFTRMVKRQVRERDGNRCRACGKGPKYPGDLTAHHIDNRKTTHHLGNLITLCRSCHALLHHGKISL